MIKWLLFFCLTIGKLSADETPSKEFIELFNYFGINSSSWEEIKHETQTKWLRKKNEERLNLSAKEDQNPQKSFSLFENIGITREVSPQKKSYDYAVILGTNLPEMKKRIEWLKSKEISFNQLVFLVGDRPLDPRCEAGYGKNETEMAKKLYSEIAPSNWKNVLFVDTPRREEERRPNTEDTFVCWKKMEPKSGSALIISSQPFIQRQGLIARKLMGNSFDIETVGRGVSYEEYLQYPNRLSIVLDELARLIYESLEGEAKHH